MTESLEKWVVINKLVVLESSMDGSDIINIESVGSFLYLKPFDGKIIDDDFSFILSDEEFEMLENKKVNYILFEFGGKFYYSGIKRDKNKYNEIIYKPEFLDFKYLGSCSEPNILDFAHLGVHSEYEMLNGSGSCELWTKKAKFLGHEFLGICDRNTLAGSLSFQSFCEKNKIKSVIGETVTVAKNYDSTKEVQETFELKLYVINEIGWKNLLKINKAINVDYNGFILEEELIKYGNGICCVISNDSEFNYFIENSATCFKIISKYKKCFDELYYQIDIVDFNSNSIFKAHLNKIDIYISKYLKFVKPILICDSYYLDEEESGLKKILNSISGVTTAESGSQYYKTVSDILELYSEWITDVEPLYNVIIYGIENTVNFSKKVNFKINTGERKLPKFEHEDSVSLFFEQIENGIAERLSDKTDEELSIYLERIETECNVIVPNGLVDYFMILWDIMRWCRENDINVGPGRGSVCGSLLAYLLRITDVDPLKYGLLFERFLNETRVSGERAKSADSLPDIDVDFPTKYRDDVKNYIKQKYGENFTCSIGTYTRMKLKTCLKDFAKIKGLSFDYMNKLTKDIDDQIEYTWGDLIEYASKSKQLFDFIQKYPEIVHLTKYALLQCKAASVHPSAVVIVPKEDLNGDPIDLFEWMPIKQIDGVYVSEWEGKYIDKSGFLKEDILGLSQLDKFKGILELIKKNKKRTLDVNKIEFDDSEVFQFFKKGWCEDVFQFGTMGLKNYCKQVKPNTIDDLIAMTSLFRPGPMEMSSHSLFAEIKNGHKKPTFDPLMEEITKETFSIYVYQEQIMKAAIIGGLSAVESDIMRTAIKKKDFKTLNSFKEKFVSEYSKKIMLIDG